MEIKDCSRCKEPYECITINRLLCDDCRVIRKREKAQRHNAKPERKEYIRKRNKRPEVKAANKRAQQKYELSPKAKIRTKKYANSKKGKAYKKDWALKNPDKVRATQKKHRQTPKYKEREKLFRKSPKGILKNQYDCAKRRERINNTKTKYTKKEWGELKNSTFGVCPKCYSEVGTGKWGIQLDHIYPLWKANDDFLETGIKRVYTIDDIRPLCGPCNNARPKFKIDMPEGSSILVKG